MGQTVVFVVDDEVVIAKTLTIILSKAGFQAYGCNCGADALEKAKETPPDFLISDVFMPGMTGVELAKQVTSQYPRCKVLLLSGVAATSDLIALAKEEGYDFECLAKPIPPFSLFVETPIGRGIKAQNPGGTGAKPLRHNLLPLRKPASSHNASIGDNAARTPADLTLGSVWRAQSQTDV
jgi:CheY-like chemotaxis protein